jgi:hypothetical protein
MTKAEIEESIHFVFGECVRFAKMTIAELQQRPRADLFCDLPHPSGRGKMNCGRAAEIRLRDITLETLALNKLSGRVSYSTMRQLLGDALVRRFPVEKREINRQQIDRLVSWLGRAALRKCSTRTHLIPCHLMYADEPGELVLGPVTFRSRKNFRARILPSVRAYDTAGDRQWTRKLLSDALQYYRSFKWVAEVTIPPADSEMSERIALETVTAALNCIHVIFGAEATDKMVIRGPRLRRDNRAHLHLDPDGKLEVRLSTRGPGQVGFGPGWASNLADSDAGRFLTNFGVALEAAANPEVNRPLSRRVLDAVYWFGEGVRDMTDAARVVKYVTTLERLLMTQEHDDIAKIVSDRASAFCLVGDDARTLQDWRDDATLAYELRSRLVHGDISPTSADVVNGLHIVASLTRFVILSVLNHFAAVGLRTENVAARRLARWFDHIVQASEELDERRRTRGTQDLNLD